MNLKEHLQFLIMMIPTVLLLIAAVVTLASPAGPDLQKPNANRHEVIVPATRLGPAQAVAVR